MGLKADGFLREVFLLCPDGVFDYCFATEVFSKPIFLSLWGVKELQDARQTNQSRSEKC